MTGLDAENSTDLLDQYEFHLWVVTFLFFFLGDLVTTGIGISMGEIVEVGPIADPIIYQYEFYGMIALKFLVMGISYGLWRLVPDPARVGVPLGLAVVGVLVTGWNSMVIVSAHI